MAIIMPVVLMEMMYYACVPSFISMFTLCYYTLLNFNVVIIPCDLLQKCVASGFSSTVARHGGLMVRVKKGGSLRTKQRLFYLPVPLRKFITLLIYSAPHNKTGIITF